MTYVSMEPIRNMARIQNEMSRWMRDVFDGADAGNTTTGLFAPPVDIIEREGDVILIADLPGVRREDIDVSVENRTLTLSGERKETAELQESTVYRAERAAGKFTRTFSLPATVDVNRISADYKDGVLRVSLPKAEHARARRIEIKTE
jgi:HSP20 family protein